MIHLQLNTSTLRDPVGVMEFILKNNVDIACLQEICYPTNSTSPLENLAEKNNYSYIEGVHFYDVISGKTIGTAIVSKYKIIDSICIYFNSSDYLPKIISKTEFNQTLLNDTVSDNIPGSRGLKHSIKSRAILSALIDTPHIPTRVISTQFTVSDLCTETEQMYNQAKLVYSLVKHAQDLPTIFAGDLNIRPQSYSVKKLSEILTCHTKDLFDTLSKNHVAKKKDFPEGLAVDHVFSKNLTHISTTANEAGLSDHKAIITKFEN